MNEPIKRKKKFSYLSAILSISMVLLLLGLFGFLVIASKHMETYLKENMVINVFLQPDVSDEDASKILTQLQSQDFTKSIKYISKDQAATDFSNELGQDFVSFLGYNPLMGSYQLKVKASFNESSALDGVEKYLKGIDKVNEINFQRNTFEQAQKNAQTIGFVFMILAGIFGIIAIVLIHNTVKLNLYAQRFIIKSMQLVGATNWFITKPFIWQSIKNGVWGWAIAWLMLISINQTIPMWIPEWKDFDHGNMLIILYGALFSIGLLISLASSFLSTRKYLRTRLEDLY